MFKHLFYLGISTMDQNKRIHLSRLVFKLFLVFLIVNSKLFSSYTYASENVSPGELLVSKQETGTDIEDSEISEVIPEKTESVAPEVIPEVADPVIPEANPEETDSDIPEVVTQEAEVVPDDVSESTGTDSDLSKAKSGNDLETEENKGEQYVFWADSYEEALLVCERKGAELVDYSNGVGVLTLRDSVTDAEEDSNLLSTDDTLLYPNYLYEIQATEQGTNKDFSKNEQWHIPLLKIEESFKIATGSGVNVAIVDSGIDIDNPSLSDGIIYAGTTIPDDAYGGTGYSILYKGPKDYTGHGTHVAGLIRANGTDPAVIGIAPECSLISIKALDRNGNTATGYTSWIVRALIEAVDRGADIVNLSLGGSKKKDIFLQEAIAMASAKGVTIVCAAGNYTGSEYQGNVDYPASDPNTVCVTAVKVEGVDILFDESYSKYGEMATVCAPGTSILSLEIGEGTKTMSGTSMACAIVSGEAALLKSLNPSMTGNKLKEYLTKDTMDLGDAGFDNYYGYGMIQPLSALESLKKDMKKDDSGKKDKDKKSEEQSQDTDEASSGESEQNPKESSTDETAPETKTDMEEGAEVKPEPAKQISEDKKEVTSPKINQQKQENTSIDENDDESVYEKEKEKLLNDLDNISPEDEIQYDTQSSVVKEITTSTGQDSQNVAALSDVGTNVETISDETVSIWIFIIPLLAVICVLLIIWLRRRHI